MPSAFSLRDNLVRRAIFLASRTDVLSRITVQPPFSAPTSSARPSSIPVIRQAPFQYGSLTRPVKLLKLNDGLEQPSSCQLVKVAVLLPCLAQLPSFTVSLLTFTACPVVTHHPNINSFASATLPSCYPATVGILICFSWITLSLPRPAQVFSPLSPLLPAPLPSALFDILNKSFQDWNGLGDRPPTIPPKLALLTSAIVFGIVQCLISKAKYFQSCPSSSLLGIMPTV